MPSGDDDKSVITSDLSATSGGSDSKASGAPGTAVAASSSTFTAGSSGFSSASASTTATATAPSPSTNTPTRFPATQPWYFCMRYDLDKEYMRKHCEDWVTAGEVSFWVMWSFLGSCSTHVCC